MAAGEARRARSAATAHIFTTSSLCAALAAACVCAVDGAGEVSNGGRLWHRRAKVHPREGPICPPSCIGVTTLPAFYPQVCTKLMKKVEGGGCRCAPEGRVFDMHRGLGVENASSPLLARVSNESFHRERAALFVDFHARWTCDRIELAHRKACLEAINYNGKNNYSACAADWPMEQLRYAIFSKGWYGTRRRLAQSAREKVGGENVRPHKFCFVGRSPWHIDMRDRVWIEDFARKHFDSTSVFVYTDLNKETATVGSDRYWKAWQPAGTPREHVPLGEWDRTLNHTLMGFVPTDAEYGSRFIQRSASNKSIYYVDSSFFELMGQCRYSVTPGGDAPWSIRFYESLALGAVPVVRSMELDARRSPEEVLAGYSVALASDESFPDDTSAAVRRNIALFERLHMLPEPYAPPPRHPLCTAPDRCPPPSELFSWSACDVRNDTARMI